MSKFDELKKRAEAATPGPWIYQEDSDAYTHIVRPASNANRIVASGCQTSAETGEPTGRFIAAANPAAILELLAILAQLVTALKQALGTIDDYLGYDHNGDPWTEDARTMGEMDINDYANDGRQAKAIAALAAAGEQS